MKNSLVRPGSLLSARQGTVVRSASAALAIAVCGGLAGCGVPSAADDAGSPTPKPSPTVTASPSPIPTTQAPPSQPPLQPLMQESEPTSEPEPTPEEETQAGGGAAAPAPVPEPRQESMYFPNCKKAKEAGAAPLYRGDPGYREELDRDRDGIACETK